MGIQSVITRVVAVAEGRFAPGYLGELTQLVPFEMVDVVYLLLAACLFPELGYPGVWGKFTAGLAGRPLARRRPAPWHRRAAGSASRSPWPTPSSATTMSSATSPSDQRDHARLGLVARFLPTPQNLPEFRRTEGSSA